jgi:molybdopterin converting factor subunit 1
MVIKLRFFASVRERLGIAETLWQGSDHETVGTIWEALKRNHPELALLEKSLAFAVNQEYVSRDYPLKDNDELALIPPVSGGRGDR